MTGTLEAPVLSTMQDVPLTVTRILVHGALVHGRTAHVTIWTGEGEPRRRSFHDVGARSAQLANALRDELGVEPGQAVATLMCSTVGKTLWL
ncbi:hypothetical protein TPA0910_14140 [Streptomyces hygroscopicus subsp. sporocinereus]|uniref:AMP-dependent synthetase/ligase domain-containing protein n=1 Tax=Streptomyces hygroscopicus TaxID=1912 RepID=A0ABQ3TUG4_STRHY|nr:hypothetical protein TPA0910_14140 [Streptomyces hygroscopicus]